MQTHIRSFSRVILPLCALIIASAAQAQTIRGRWTGSIDAGLDLASDPPVVVKREPLVLDLAMRGDTVVGTIDRGTRWRADVRGKFDGVRLELQASALEKNFYADGRLVTDTIRYTWRGTLERGELRGGLTTDPAHSRMPALRWEAKQP